MTKGNAPTQRELTGATELFTVRILTMKTATLVKPALVNQVSQISENYGVITTEYQPEMINPSRSINKCDELYLRNYKLAALVISWDLAVCDTAARVTPEDITNIALDGDTVWYQLNHFKAIPLNIEVFHSHRLQIQQQAIWDAELTSDRNEFEGESIRGGNVAIVATPSSQSPEVTATADWTVEYEPRWGVYQARVGDRCIGKAETLETAERLAQQYLGKRELMIAA